MTIIYQGSATETDTTTVGAFLTAKAVDAARTIVEFADEIYAPGTDLSAIPLLPGKALNVYRLTTGG